MKLVEQTIDHWIELARQIATQAHEGQTRNGGEPYITHSEAVANVVEDRLKPIAWLHDVIEDTNVTLENLKQAGFPSYIVNAVDLLTHRDKEPNVVYWRKMLVNPDAVIVKIADIKHNLSSNPSIHSKEKYIKALAVFKAAGYSI